MVDTVAKKRKKEVIQSDSEDGRGPYLVTETEAVAEVPQEKSVDDDAEIEEVKDQLEEAI